MKKEERGKRAERREKIEEIWKEIEEAEKGGEYKGLEEMFGGSVKYEGWVREREERGEKERAKVVEIGEDGVMRIKNRVDEAKVEIERVIEYIEKAIIPVIRGGNKVEIREGKNGWAIEVTD